MTNRIHKRGLRSIYNDYTSDYNTLLSTNNHCTIHQRNIKLLSIEVSKCLNKETPPFLWDLFKRNQSNHNLRISNRLKLPKASTQTSLHSITYRGSSYWNNIPDKIKNTDNSSTFKQNLKNFNVANICTCKICM